MKSFLFTAENLISGAFPMAFLLLSGVYFTLKTRGVQFRKFFTAIKFSLGIKKGGGDGISSFGAVCNSLAATVGTGNIAGVAAAISIGGAGAVFWMWISAFIGMAVKAAEIIIAVANRRSGIDGYYGGPMYYIKEKLGKGFMPLAVVFSLACVLSSFTTGNITQINACVSVMDTSLFQKIAIGVFFTIAVAVIIMGGAKKITNFTTVVLPAMAVLYILLCLGVIIKNFALVDNAFISIFKGAFSPSSVTGGAVGSFYSTVITGAQKGIFSNEAGLGTASMAHAAARDAKAETQGFFGIFEVFVDTLLICTLTALTILCSGVIIDYNSVASSGLVNSSLQTLYGEVSGLLLSVMLCLFALSSVLGWAAYGITASEFLFGKKGKRIYCFIYPLFSLVGAVMNVSSAWRIAELFNGIMLIINVFSVLCLRETAVFNLKGVANERKNTKFTKRIAKGRGGIDNGHR